MERILVKAGLVMELNEFLYNSVLQIYKTVLFSKDF